VSNERNVREIVLKQLPHFKLHVILSGIISLIIQLVGLIPPIIMQYIIDKAIPDHNLKQILISIFWFCFIPLLSTFLTTTYKYVLAIVCRKFGQGLTIAGFEKLMYQPIAFFDKQNSSELASYCRGESMKYVVFWVIDIPQLVANILCGIVIFGYLLKINWLIALFVLLYFPFAFIPSNKFAKRVKDYSKRIVSNNAKMNQIVNDTFRGIKFVKSMVLEKAQLGKLNEVNEDSVKIWSKAALFDNLSGLWVNELSNSLFTGVTFAIAAIFILNDQMTIGTLIILLNYSSRFYSVANQMVHTNYNFKVQLGEYDKFFDILSMETSTDYNKDPLSFEKTIDFKNVVFAYEESRGDVLKGLNLQINKNEWLGIVGSSGAGKTTIFDLLLSFYQPQSGEISVDGKPLDRFSIESIRTKITKVSQDTFLFPGTIKDNLLLANPNATDEEILNVLELVCLKDFISNLPNGLNTDIGENGLLLSGGERQRLALAQGILRKSEIILLDEVTANIDVNSERIIKEVIKDIMLKQNLTVIAISHRIDFLEDTDRIVILENGKISKTTTYSENESWTVVS
jgi:ABC-type multidrug transport system fused ATPase/permease subunit